MEMTWYTYDHKIQRIFLKCYMHPSLKPQNWQITSLNSVSTPSQTKTQTKTEERLDHIKKNCKILINMIKYDLVNIV